eukprot:3818467-Rhodomonas_salina.2
MNTVCLDSSKLASSKSSDRRPDELVGTLCDIRTDSVLFYQLNDASRNSSFRHRARVERQIRFGIRTMQVLIIDPLCALCDVRYFNLLFNWRGGHSILGLRMDGTSITAILAELSLCPNLFLSLARSLSPSLPLCPLCPLSSSHGTLSLRLSGGPADAVGVLNVGDTIVEVAGRAPPDES